MMLPLASAAPAGGWLAFVLVFVVGACVGSFLNVCIHRLPAEESVVRPGSRCPRCRGAWTYVRTAGVEGMGLGGVKLLAMIGAFLGWQAIPAVLIIASITGSVAGLAVMLGPRGRATRRRAVRRLGWRALAPFVRR